jgi:hypothetical protein
MGGGLAQTVSESLRPGRLGADRSVSPAGDRKARAEHKRPDASAGWRDAARIKNEQLAENAGQGRQPRLAIAAMKNRAASRVAPARSGPRTSRSASRRSLAA